MRCRWGCGQLGAGGRGPRRGPSSSIWLKACLQGVECLRLAVSECDSGVKGEGQVSSCCVSCLLLLVLSLPLAVLGGVQLDNPSRGTGWFRGGGGTS